MFTKGVNDIYIFFIAIKNIIIKLITRILDLFIENVNTSLPNKSDQFQGIQTTSTSTQSQSTQSTTTFNKKTKYEQILDLLDTIKKPEFKDENLNKIGKKATIENNIFSFNMDNYNNFSIDIPEQSKTFLSLNEMQLTQNFIDKNKPYKDRCWDELS